MRRCWRSWNGRFAGQLATEHDREILLRRLQDSFSNVIQLSPTKGCLAEDPVAEIEVMASIYLEAAKVGGKREVSGRRRILGRMRDAFEQAGVAKFVPPVPVAPYTRPGDPFQFDFGYRVKGEIKLFQAVSLKARGWMRRFCWPPAIQRLRQLCRK